MGCGLLHRQLIHDGLPLELDAVEHDTEGPSEGHVEGPSHVLHVLVLFVKLISLTTNFESAWCKAVLELLLA